MDSIFAALAVAEVLDIPREEALRALAPLQPLPGRMSWLDGVDGLTLLDDSHNAIPASATMGLNTLMSIGDVLNRRVSRRWRHARLGDAAKREHRKLGETAARSTDYLIVRGAQAEMWHPPRARQGCPQERV